MATWTNIFTTINANAELHDNTVDLANLNDGFIIDNYEKNQYEFISHNYTVVVDKNMNDEHLLKIFDAYLQNTDAFDAVVDKFNLLKFTDNTYVSVFEFISPLTLIAKYNKFNFEPQTFQFNCNDDFWTKFAHKLSFNKSTDKIDYAFATINTNDIYDDSHCITIQWTVYTLPNNCTATIQDAKRFIIDNLLQRFNTPESLQFDSDHYYFNFGLNLIELA